MKQYKVLTVFDYDSFQYCFDDIEKLFSYIKFHLDDDSNFYIETIWLSEEQIKKLNIIYIKDSLFF